MPRAPPAGCACPAGIAHQLARCPVQRFCLHGGQRGRGTLRGLVARPVDRPERGADSPSTALRSAAIGPAATSGVVETGRSRSSEMPCASDSRGLRSPMRRRAAATAWRCGSAAALRRAAPAACAGPAVAWPSSAPAAARSVAARAPCRRPCRSGAPRGPPDLSSPRCTGCRPRGPSSRTPASPRSLHNGTPHVAPPCASGSTGRPAGGAARRPAASRPRTAAHGPGDGRPARRRQPADRRAPGSQQGRQHVAANAANARVASCAARAATDPRGWPDHGRRVVRRAARRCSPGRLALFAGPPG